MPLPLDVAAVAAEVMHATQLGIEALKKHTVSAQLKLGQQHLYDGVAQLSEHKEDISGPALSHLMHESHELEQTEGQVKVQHDKTLGCIRALRPAHGFNHRAEDFHDDVLRTTHQAQIFQIHQYMNKQRREEFARDLEEERALRRSSLRYPPEYSRKDPTQPPAKRDRLRAAPPYDELPRLHHFYPDPSKRAVTLEPYVPRPLHDDPPLWPPAYGHECCEECDSGWCNSGFVVTVSPACPDCPPPEFAVVPLSSLAGSSRHGDNSDAGRAPGNGSEAPNKLKSSHEKHRKGQHQRPSESRYRSENAHGTEKPNKSDKHHRTVKTDRGGQPETHTIGKKSRHVEKHPKPEKAHHRTNKRTVSSQQRPSDVRLTHSSTDSKSVVRKRPHGTMPS